MSRLQRLVLTAWLLALGLVLPMAFGQLPQIGRMLLPMHIPVFLCAFLCGKRMAAGMAFLLPLVRYALFLLPAFPVAVALELATYAAVTGWMYERCAVSSPRAVYTSLLLAMVCGRVVRLVAQGGFLLLAGAPGVIPAFLTGTMAVGLIGAAAHLVLVPPIVLLCVRLIKQK